MTPDVNVLIAAARGEHEHHAQAIRWLDSAIAHAGARTDSLVLLPVVLSGYLRLMQAPVFRSRVDPVRSLEFIERLVAQPNVAVVRQGAEWATYAQLYRRHLPVGASVTDVWIAASVLHLGERLVTLDRGFRRLLPAASLTLLEPAAA